MSRRSAHATARDLSSRELSHAGKASALCADSASGQPNSAWPPHFGAAAPLIQRPLCPAETTRKLIEPAAAAPRCSEVGVSAAATPPPAESAASAHSLAAACAESAPAPLAALCTGVPGKRKLKPPERGAGCSGCELSGAAGGGWQRPSARAGGARGGEVVGGPASKWGRAAQPSPAALARGGLSSS